MMLYETHCHTSGGSFCGKIAPEDQVDCYHKMGYAGICLTEHFPISKKFEITDWNAQVDLIENSFLAAEKRGREVGVQVFFAYEYGYKGTDILTYGLGTDWLRAHPEIAEMRVEEYMRLAHDEGAFLVHAHPFRAAKYIKAIRLVPDLTDAVEVINANRSDFENGEALHYAEAYGLKKSVGTDNHVGFNKRMCALQVERKLENVGDVIETIRTASFEIFDREQWIPTEA